MLRGTSRIVVVSVLVALFVGGLSLAWHSQVQAQTVRASLVNLTPQEIAQKAITLTQVEYRVTGTPEIALARRVTPADLPALGFATPLTIPCAAPPMVVVILHGTVDLSATSRLPAASWYSQAQYIAYIFDLQEGAMMYEQTSTFGGSFRAALNNPNLPADPTVRPGGTSVQSPTTPAIARPVPPEAPSACNGAVAPPVAAPVVAPKH